MSERSLWAKILIIAGGMGILVGSIDPLEGSVVILPGSGLFALGTYLGQAERRLIAYRASVFVLIAIGVAALWGLSAAGGIGGTTGRSIWWGLLILPYLIGWLMVMWGPQSPRWFSWLGIALCLWYLALSEIVGFQLGLADGNWWPAILIGATGLAGMAGCAYRLIKQR